MIKKTKKELEFIQFVKMNVKNMELNAHYEM